MHLYLPNLLGYVRFVAIIASWKFALNDPMVFTALYATSYLLGAVDGTVARALKQCSFFGAQLDILMSRFATESLIFVVLKLGILNIKDDQEVMRFTLLFVTFFLSDFVSYWFQVYSSYLLDQESHVTSNPAIQATLKLYKNPLVNFTVTALSEFFTFSFYMSFFPNQFKFVTAHPSYNIILQLALVGAILKNLHNLLHLWTSSIRIVGLDCA